MIWSEEYQRKRMSAAQALETVTSGARVWIQSGCGTPSVLVDALVARAPALRDVEIVHMKTLGDGGLHAPEYEGHFRHRGLFLGDNVREAVCDGRADYTPIFLSEIEGLFETGSAAARCGADAGVATGCARIREPGHDGGLHADAVRYAKTVIAEVNRADAAHTWRDNVHVSHISAIVESDRPLLELEAENR